MRYSKKQAKKWAKYFQLKYGKKSKKSFQSWLTR